MPEDEEMRESEELDSEKLAAEEAEASEPVEESEPEADEPDGEDAAEEDSEEPADNPVPQGIVQRYWLLGLGVLLGLMGVAGMIMLRTNYAQVYIFGELDPYTGIGPDEAMGHMVSVVPFIIGVVAVVFWGIKTPEIPDPAEELDKGCAEEEMECAEAEEFGHEHLPPHHLTTVEKIEHLTKVYAQGKMSKGLYDENLKKFESDLDHERSRARKASEDAEEKPAAKGRSSAYNELKSLKPEMAKNEADHLPPHHLSPEEKIDHLTKSYSQGKVSQAFFEKNMKKFETELKREKEYLPPADLHPRQKLEQLEDAYGMGVISRSTYDRNKRVFEAELGSRKDSVEEADIDFKAEVAPEQSLDDDLDSLLKVAEEDGKKKPEAKKKTLLEELEELEDL